MKRIIPLLATLFLAACGTTKATTNWTTVVQPYDQPPTECTKPPGPPPQLALRDHTGDMAKTAYRRLANSRADLSVEYRKCQAWARGQRK